MRHSRLILLLLLACLMGGHTFAQVPRCTGPACPVVPWPQNPAPRPATAQWVPLKDFEALRSASSQSHERLHAEIESLANHNDQLVDQLGAVTERSNTHSRLIADVAKGLSILQQRVDDLGTNQLEIVGQVQSVGERVSQLQQAEQVQAGLLARLSEQMTGVIHADTRPDSGTPGVADADTSHADRSHPRLSLMSRLRATFVHGAPLALALGEAAGLTVATGGAGLAIPLVWWGIGALFRRRRSGGGRREEGRPAPPFPHRPPPTAGRFEPYDTGRIRSADGGPVVDRFADIER